MQPMQSLQWPKESQNPQLRSNLGFSDRTRIIKHGSDRLSRSEPALAAAKRICYYFELHGLGYVAHISDIIDDEYNTGRYTENQHLEVPNQKELYPPRV